MISMSTISFVVTHLSQKFYLITDINASVVHHVTCCEKRFTRGVTCTRGVREERHD